MEEVNALRGMDIYLIDQLVKGAIESKYRILDAGCGNGRNSHYLIQQGYDVTAFDENAEVIEGLKSLYPDHEKRSFCSIVEDFSSTTRFDFIIGNAVLHFAKDHTHFENMVASLVNVLEVGGILFIRMT